MDTDLQSPRAATPAEGQSRLSAVVITSAVAGIVLLLTLVAAGTARQIVTSTASDRLDQRSAAALEAIDRRMQAYTDSVFGGRGMFTTGPVSHADYRTFVDALDLTDRYPGIQVLGHASLVRDDDLQDYVATVNTDTAPLGYPEFVPYPEGQREDYVPIDYVEPILGNEAAFGLDFFSEENRRAAVELTRDTGRFAATAPVVLVQETGSQSGFLTMIGIYDNLQGDDVQSRRDSFAGVSYAAFRMGDLITGVLDNTSARLEIYDIGDNDNVIAPSRENQTYSDGGLAVAIGDIDAATSRLMSFEIGGRQWAVLYESLTPLTTTVERSASLGLLLSGLLITALAAAGTWFQATGRERAERRAMDMTRDLRDSREELARSNIELERFAYIASHDLQEPLRTVSSFVGLLEMQYSDDLDEKAKSYIAFARDGATRMSVLIRELLDYSRAGRDHVLEPVDLNDAFARASADLTAAIADADATVTVDSLPMVMAEQASMTQVFVNLIGNALKYRSDAAVEISCSARRQADGSWRIEVTDNGIGIAPKYHDDVFVMLRRLHTREEFSGTGMGLAISKKHIEAAGGAIGVDSAIGRGSTFWFTALPAEVSDQVLASR